MHDRSREAPALFLTHWCFGLEVSVQGRFVRRVVYRGTMTRRNAEVAAWTVASLFLLGVVLVMVGASRYALDPTLW